MTVVEEIAKYKVIAIVRGLAPDKVLPVARALYEGGIRLLEITMNSEQPLTVISQLQQQMGSEIIIGAGTVLDVKMAQDAMNAGARFVLSPVVDPDVIGIAKNNNVVSIPGAYTATEIWNAWKLGADIVKVFPANTPSYVKDILAPLPQIPLLPTGGVTVDNAGAFLKAGALGVGVGSALVNANQKITDEYLRLLTEKAREFVKATQI